MIIFYFGLVSTLLSAVPAALSWRTPQGQEWWLLLAIGAFGSVGQLLLTAAYAHAPAARVGPFIYSSVVFAGLLEWALWKSVPDALSFAGMIVVAVAGIIALRIGADPPQPAVAPERRFRLSYAAVLFAFLRPGRKLAKTSKIPSTTAQKARSRYAFRETLRTWRPSWSPAWPHRRVRPRAGRPRTWRATTSSGTNKTSGSSARTSRSSPVSSEAASAHNGITHVHLQQVYRGSRSTTASSPSTSARTAACSARAAASSPGSPPSRKGRAPARRPPKRQSPPPGT